MEKQGGSWKTGFFSLLALIIIGASVFAWNYFNSRKNSTSVSASPLPSAEASNISPSPIANETQQIEEAVFKLTGLDPTKAEITINENTGQHATGNIKEFEAVGGAYWIAAKVGKQWVGVYAGQSQPKCSEIAPYNFPRDMVPECLDKSNKVMAR